jgi:propionyl-CoA carboxylase alpha chain
MNNFLPSVGKLEVYQKPSGENIRLDDGFEEGMEVPIYYDPMISKLCTFGITREAAIKRMLEAIAMYRIEGVATTLPFGKFVCQHPAFTSGDFDTHFVPKYFTPEGIAADGEGEVEVAARLALKLFQQHQATLTIPHPGSPNWGLVR